MQTELLAHANASARTNTEATVIYVTLVEGALKYERVATFCTFCYDRETNQIFILPTFFSVKILKIKNVVLHELIMCCFMVQNIQRYIN